MKHFVSRALLLIVKATEAPQPVTSPGADTFGLDSSVDSAANTMVPKPAQQLSPPVA